MSEQPDTSRRPGALVAILVALALVAAAVVAVALLRGGEDGSPAAGTSTSSSASSSASTSSTSSSKASSGTDDGSSSTSSPRSSSTSTEGSPDGETTDPEVEVTPSSEVSLSAEQVAAGKAAADSGAGVSSVSIPAIGLEHDLEAQGLRDGKVNPQAHQVIWFTGYDRVLPGATGTSVIAGHVTSGGGPDAFAALEDVELGDDIVITYPGGERLRFEISRAEIVDKTDLQHDADVWGQNSQARRVVLVTCDDELGFREDGHRKANFVVVAEQA